MGGSLAMGFSYRSLSEPTESRVLERFEPPRVGGGEAFAAIRSGSNPHQLWMQTGRFHDVVKNVQRADTKLFERVVVTEQRQKDIDIRDDCFSEELVGGP